MARKVSRADRDPDGNLYVRYLYWNDDGWNWNDDWLDDDWNSDNPAAVLASLFMTPSDELRGSFVS